MSGNRSLTTAKRLKNDEFYTQRLDIEAELGFYASCFDNKVVYCNCDDAEKSEFWNFFEDSFQRLNLKRLVATCQDLNAPGRVSILESNHGIRNVKHIVLQGDGDFESDECLDFLKQCDIVVTNPPFSLFRGYMSRLMAYDKKFLIIGNMNAITYKEIFPFIKSNQIWLGVHSGDMSFKVPDYYEARATRFWIDSSGQKWRSLGNVCWFTNLDYSHRHELLDLSANKYSGHESLYPKYDNYDAINVDRVCDIPCDYAGIMGVPITFLAKYCPEQFEILGVFNHGKDGPWDFAPCVVNGVAKYKRLAIRLK